MRIFLNIFFTFLGLMMPFCSVMADNVLNKTDTVLAPVEISPLEKIAALQDGFIVMELFTSQACVFCPKADVFMKDFTVPEHVIALSCHVDYFNVKVGSLSLPECGQRQEMFESSLHQGPKFTPQMVINGTKSVVGYRQADVWRALDQAIIEPAKVGIILPVPHGDEFDLTLPEVNSKSLNLIAMTFDSIKTVKITDGTNKGKTLTYYNTVMSVSDLGSWSGEAKTIHFSAENTVGRSGIVVLGQDRTTGAILVAAKYSFPTSAK